MEFLFEFLREGRDRVRSNAFVSVVIAFAAINWREIYFVVFADVSASVKINYFDANTDGWSLIVYPLGVGISLALILPVLNNGVHWWTSKFAYGIRKRDDLEAHESLKRKNEWKELRNREQELLARKLVSAAQLNQEIDDTIENEAAREELKTKIDTIKITSGGADEPEKPKTVLEIAQLILLDYLRRSSGKILHGVDDEYLGISGYQEWEAISDTLSSEAGVKVDIARSVVEINAARDALIKAGCVTWDTESSLLKYTIITSTGYNMLDGSTIKVDWPTPE